LAYANSAAREKTALQESKAGFADYKNTCPKTLWVADSDIVRKRRAAVFQVARNDLHTRSLTEFDYFLAFRLAPISKRPV
jgi:hypothetical protein